MEDVDMVANFSEGQPWQLFKDTIVQVNLNTMIQLSR